MMEPEDKQLITWALYGFCRRIHRRTSLGDHDSMMWPPDEHLSALFVTAAFCLTFLLCLFAWGGLYS